MSASIILKPVITEKATKLSEKGNTYTFRVSKEANKLEIKKAIEKLYNVHVADIGTATNPGKAKIRQTKQGVARGIKPSYKKAFVTVKAGESIDFYGTV